MLTPSPLCSRSSWRRLVVGLSLLAFLVGGATTASADLMASGALAAEPSPAVGAPADASGVTAAAVVGANGVPRPDHVVVVMMENKDRTSIIGSSSAPYLNALAKRGANMTQSYGVTHPSQPNYVALFSGALHGVTNNDCPRNLGNTPNLGSQLESAGLSFFGFSESIPYAGYTGCSSGRYQRKHNAVANFANLRPGLNQPLTALPTDFNRLPTVSFVTPNMCNDMHDCSVATGDAWLKANFDAYATWAQTHNSLLVVTFDENAGGTVNQIATLLVGQMVRPGSYPERMNHYNLLRTIEDAYRLAPLGWAADVAPLKTIWTTSPAPVTGIANGGFEGQLTGWAASGSTYSSTNVKHLGERSARAGALVDTRGDSILSQTIVAPAGKTRLDLWWNGRCEDTVTKAWATVIVKRNTSNNVSTLLPRTCVRDGTWRRVGVGVTPGNSYTIQLINHDDGGTSTPNRTYFDDVTLS